MLGSIDLCRIELAIPAASASFSSVTIFALSTIVIEWNPLDLRIIREKIQTLI